LDVKGIPETRTCFVKLSECEILDTWYTTGLRGTGSHDIAIRDVFVPAEHTFSFQDPELVKRPGPLYAFPLMFIAKGAAPALGIARRAIDILVESSGRKAARRMMIGELAAREDAAR
jgi:alkylation response protein AidB-like acyl-CoA dehydrogenase